MATIPITEGPPPASHGQRCGHCNKPILQDFDYRDWTHLLFAVPPTGCQQTHCEVFLGAIGFPLQKEAS